jgi:hypothetical protein
MNLFLTQMTFQGAGPNALSRAIAVEVDLNNVEIAMGRLIPATYRHSILVQGKLLAFEVFCVESVRACLERFDLSIKKNVLYYC